MKTPLVIIALAVILAGWASWMFRYETKIITSSYSGTTLFTVLDRWKQKQTVCLLDEEDYVIWSRDCGVIGERQMGFR